MGKGKKEQQSRGICFVELNQTYAAVSLEMDPEEIRNWLVLRYS